VFLIAGPRLFGDNLKHDGDIARRRESPVSLAQDLRQLLSDLPVNTRYKKRDIPSRQNVCHLLKQLRYLLLGDISTELDKSII